MASKNTNFKRTTCRLCDSSNLTLSLPLKATPLADSYIPEKLLNEDQEIFPLDLLLCNDCGHVQTGHVVYAEEIYLDYIYKTTSSVGLPEHFKTYAQDVLNYVQFDANDIQNKLIMDIGSNDGTLLKCFKQHGVKVLGVEPASHIAKQATEEGVFTIPNFFSLKLSQEINEKFGKADVITSNNLVANIDELHDFVDGIANLLSKDGLFIFESFYLADQIKNMVFDFTYHEHLSYFSAKPLQKFFDRHGLELVDAENIDTKGGSLRYFIQLKGGKRQVSERLTAIMNYESEINLHSLEAFKAFEVRIDQAKQNVLNQLNQYKQEGKKIVAYGASATSTTLIYHFDLGSYFDYLIDDNPAKQNLYSPGLHIPVLTSSALYDETTRPDIVVILAWRFVKNIQAGHQKYLDNGGLFVIPLPELKILTQ